MQEECHNQTSYYVVNNICNMMTKWYENIARMHNIPLIMIDIPFSNTVDVPEEKN